MRILLYLVLGFPLLWHNLAIAEEWRQDAKLLPQYCQDRVKGITSAEFSRWRGTLGSVFEHAHHYCSGIYAEQKANSAYDPQARTHWLSNTAREMAYVSRHCSARCALYPELHTRWGWALGANGQAGEAINHFQLAIKANPKYVPAYAKLADLYVDIKQPDEARKILNRGLKAKPGSSMLKRRLKELDKG